MFDVLTYEKGASVLRMLEQYLGPERFRAGVRRYLSRPPLRQHRDDRPLGRDRGRRRRRADPGADGLVDLPGRPSPRHRAGGGSDVVLSQKPFSYLPACDRPPGWLRTERHRLGTGSFPVATERRPRTSEPGAAAITTCLRSAGPGARRPGDARGQRRSERRLPAAVRGRVCSTTSWPASSGSSRSSDSRSSPTPGHALSPGRPRSSSSSRSSGASRASSTRACGRWSQARSASRLRGLRRRPRRARGLRPVAACGPSSNESAGIARGRR